MLAWEEGDLAGLEIVIRSLSLAQFFEMQDKSDEDGGVLRSISESFARALRSWNLEDDDGQPVPPDLAGLLSQDMEFVQEVVVAWQRAMSGAGVPKDGTSSSGEPFPVASLPMEVLSANQAM